MPPSQLQAIILRELRTGHHHRRRVLFVDRAEPVATGLLCSATVVRDSTSDLERLQIYIHTRSHGQIILDLGWRYAIKEPFLTLNDGGKQTLHIDHSTDLPVLDSIDNDGHDDSPSIAEHMSIACVDMRNAATSISSDGHKHQASAHTLYGIPGRIAYDAGNFEQAKILYDCQARVVPTDKHAMAQLRKAEARLREQIDGAYDFEPIKGSLSESNPRVEAASFLRKTEVGPSDGRKQNLLATQDIDLGELILCEKAFCDLSSFEDPAFLTQVYSFREPDSMTVNARVALWKAVVQKLLRGSPQTEQLLNLSCRGYEGICNKATKVDNRSVVDVFHVYDILARNEFATMSEDHKIPDVSPHNFSIGIWPHSANIKESCPLNARPHVIGDLLVLRANK